MAYQAWGKVLCRSRNGKTQALMFSSLKKPVADAFRRTGLLDLLGQENVFPDKETAIETARQRNDLLPA